MPVSKAKKLSSLFSSAFKATSSLIPKSGHVASSSPATCSIQFPKRKTRSKKTQLSDTLLNPHSSPHSDNSAKDLPLEISALLFEDTSSNTSSLPKDTSSSTSNLPDNSAVNILNITWVQSLSQEKSILCRKEISRGRKQKWVFKVTQPRRFERLVNLCGEKLGSDATMDVFGKLGRESGKKEYNALIGLCIKNSKTAENEEVTIEQISKVFRLLKFMREQGLQLEEDTYGQFLIFLIDKEMVEELKFFCEIIRHENPDSLPRLAYYEMLLWIRLDDEDKIKELCDFVAINDDADNSSIRENCLLALCGSERRKELLVLLDIIDITKIRSIVHLATIFRSLAKFSLELFAKKFILTLKTCDIGTENLSKLIYDYAVTIPNLAVQDAIFKFKSLHEEWGVKPASASYEKFIKHCCILLKVHAALDIIDHMIEVGLTLSLESFHLILQTCKESCDYNLVHRIYSVIRHYKVKSEEETLFPDIFRIMISLSVRMKDFEGAYNMIKDMEKMNVKPTTGIYNTIMAAHFREKNIQAGLQVFKKMESPDSQTFSYLIGNCDRVEDITKYYERLKLSQVQPTKHVFMALINAYTSCGQLEKAKQVVFEEGLPVKNLKEVKSVLVSALACHGDVFDALSMYEGIKQAEGGYADPKTIICLIENLRSKEHLSKMLDLLEDFNDTEYWIEGCCRIIVHCVQYKDLRSTVNLMKQLKDKFCDDDFATGNLYDEAFCKIAEMEQADMQFGMDLLQSIKNELEVRPSRQSLEFLLHACIGTKDLKTAHVIWQEYEAAQLPYNVLNYLRMYQVFLACGDRQSAKKIKTKIPLGDPHIRCVLKAYQTAYKSPKKKKKKKDEQVYIEN